MLNYELYGKGEEKVIVLHDWFTDKSSYEALKPFLATDNFQYAFVDLRGYGGSLELEGNHSFEEAAQDILEIASHLNWQSFHFIGHSMTGMLAQYLIAYYSYKLDNVIAITPVPASGAQPTEDVAQFMMEGANNNINNAREIINMLTSSNYDQYFLDYKATNWHSKSTSKARVENFKNFAYSDFSQDLKNHSHPLLVITGSNDIEGHSSQNIN